MKRTLALILAIAMALALVACGNKQAPSANSGDESVPNTGKTYEWDWCMTGGKTLMTEIATEMVEEIKTATLSVKHHRSSCWRNALCGF